MILFILQKTYKYVCFYINAYKSMFQLTTTKSLSLTEWLTELKEFRLDGYFSTPILGRSYEYIPMVTSITTTKNQNIYKLIGSQVYDVKIEMIDGGIFGQCSCPYDRPCKHIAAVILWEMKLDLS